MKAFQVWVDGEGWWEIRDGGTFVATVAEKSEAAEYGAVEFVETDEPRFLVRDRSGRGWCVETLYSSFDADERAHNEDEDDEYSQTFGEWLDSSSAGEEYDNSDTMQTIIRIN
jgi:hypothetical protein